MGHYLNSLEKFYKKDLKPLLSIPVTTADPAMYTISGTVPLEATIYKRALTLFGNICWLSVASFEKKDANRQLHIKGHKSNSWCVAVKELCLNYGLSHPLEILEDPLSKDAWSRIGSKQVNNYWADGIKWNAFLYTRLKYLHMEDYGRQHPVIYTIGNAREIPRINTKLKLVTGT